MPVYKSLAHFSKECTAWNAGLQKTMVAGVNAAAFVTKKAILTEADNQRWPRKAAKSRRRPIVAVRYDIVSGGRNPTALVQLRSGHMYEFGAKAHDIVPRRRGSANALTTPFGAYARVKHPGFRGRDFWHRGVNTARPLVKKAFGRAVAGSMVRSFGK